MANIPNLQFNTSTAAGSPMYGQGAAVAPNTSFYQSNSIFMAPIGNIYGLNTSSDVGNMPTGSGVSVGLCLSEGTMYLKSMQGTGPVLLGYKLSPLDGQNMAVAPSASNEKVETLLSQFSEKLSQLEKKVDSLQPKGGKQEWQI